eukprot:gene5195-biopygen20674
MGSAPDFGGAAMSTARANGRHNPGKCGTCGNSCLERGPRPPPPPPNHPPRNLAAWAAPPYPDPGGYHLSGQISTDAVHPRTARGRAHALGPSAMKPATNGCRPAPADSRLPPPPRDHRGLSRGLPKHEADGGAPSGAPPPSHRNCGAHIQGRPPPSCRDGCAPPPPIAGGVSGRGRALPSGQRRGTARKSGGGMRRRRRYPRKMKQNGGSRGNTASQAPQRGGGMGGSDQGEQEGGAGVAGAWRGRGAGCMHLLAWGGAGVARVFPVPPRVEVTRGETDHGIDQG